MCLNAFPNYTDAHAHHTAQRRDAHQHRVGLNQRDGSIMVVTFSNLTQSHPIPNPNSYDNVVPNQNPDKCVNPATCMRFQRTCATRFTPPIPNHNTNPNTHRWNLRVLFTVAAALGGVACASSLFLLYIALDSWNPAGVWAKLGLAGLTYGQVTTMVYLKVSISDFLTLFSSRSTSWFWENKVRGVALCGWICGWMDRSTASLPQSQTTTSTDIIQSHKHIRTVTSPNTTTALQDPPPRRGHRPLPLHLPGQRLAAIGARRHPHRRPRPPAARAPRPLRLALLPGLLDRAGRRQGCHLPVRGWEGFRLGLGLVWSVD